MIMMTSTPDIAYVTNAPGPVFFITTLEPTRGADPNSVRTKLITEHHVVTTVAGIERAPFEMKIPVLRVSPHVDVTDEELESFAGALTAAST